jgi:mannosyl-glycoprotein endo-beta-N-acetylglucosaminidase
VEPADAADAGRILEKGSEGEYLFAVQLARVAETYGFDGWLLNLECAIPPEKWMGPGELQRFLEELRGAGCRVVWYDALTVLNRVSYQNGLTLLNAPFLSAAGEMLANYWWRRPQLEASAAMAELMGKREGVFMGVDCYGRGSLGGGGYGVGVALEEVRKAGLQASLFAPGWTWENFGGTGFREVERKFWGVVAETVAPKPAGCNGEFYTCFSRGFGSGFWVLGKVSGRGQDASGNPC